MKENADEVATHVLVPMSVAERLRELAKKTRVTQSEYLREAVSDLLKKYDEPEEAGASAVASEVDGSNA
jgi:predicted DNA-binding protein